MELKSSITCLLKSIQKVLEILLYDLLLVWVQEDEESGKCAEYSVPGKWYENLSAARWVGTFISVGERLVLWSHSIQTILHVS